MLGIRSAATNPELREVVVEASLSLARLDAERLEELAVWCGDFNRDRMLVGNAECAEWARQARQASGELAVFGRVLEATRSNLEVMKRLRERRAARLEYGGPGGPWVLAERCDGNH